MKTVILISGRIGSGKTYLANELKESLKHPTEILAFAEPLKNIVVDLINLFYEPQGGFNLHDLNNIKNRQGTITNLNSLNLDVMFHVRSVLLIGWLCALWFGPKLFMAALIIYYLVCQYALLKSISVRHILQQVGTEILRKHLGGNIFVDRAVISQANSRAQYVIFHDLRFQNELDVFIEDPQIRLIVVKINSAQDQFSTHSSELGLDFEGVDPIYIDNDHGQQYRHGLDLILQRIDI
jgi:hypothetical protein